MTVNKVLGRNNGQSGGTITLEKSSSSVFWFWQKDADYGFLVLSKDLNQYEDQIVTTSGIPQIGTLFNNVYVRSLSAHEIDRISRHPTYGVPCALWQVVVHTDSRFDPAQALTSNTDDPTDLRPRRRWYTEKEQRKIEVDINGDRIVTAAGEPIPYEGPFIVVCLEIERYENYPTDPATIRAYINHVNSTTFYGFPIGTALLDDIQSDEEVINNITVIKTRYVFKFYLIWNDDLGAYETDTAGDVSLLNEGYLYLPAVGAAPITFPDANGHPRKLNLNTDGTLLPDTSPPTFAIYPIIPDVDFGPLNLEF